MIPRDERDEEAGRIFETKIHPLSEYENQFNQLSYSPFSEYLEEVVYSKDYAERTIRKHELPIERWEKFARQRGYHPACPMAGELKEHLSWLYESFNIDGPTARRYIGEIVAAFAFLARQEKYPLTVSNTPFLGDEFNMDEFDFSRRKKKKKLHQISLGKLRTILRGVPNILHLLTIVSQFKLTNRVSALANMKISDMNIDNAELKNHFPKMGTHPKVVDRPNSVYIPTQGERDGNKSAKGRVIPLDDELRHLIQMYLLIRPESNKPWLLLTSSGEQTNRKQLNKYWKIYFLPEYDEDEYHRRVTSNFGRHWSTTFWKTGSDVMNRAEVYYLRGDDLTSREDAETADIYTHVFYEDIRDKYLDNVFKLGIL